MTGRIDRYVRRHVLLAMAVVALVLLGLDFIFSLFEEIGDTDETYGAADALRYILLTLPRHLYELLPMTALLGALIGLGILATNNELVVMRAAGVSALRIVWSVMKPAFLVMALGLGLGEFVAPPLELRAEIGKALASGEESALSRYGSWQREGNTFMHFNAIDPRGELHGITLYRYDEEFRLRANTFAERAEYLGPGRWRLIGVNETRFLWEDEGLSSSNHQHDSLPWQVNLSPELLQVLIVDADRMAVSDLWRFAGHFEGQGQDASQYYLSFWKKVLQPLTTGALVLVAVSFIFGPLRQAAMGGRLFAAICFGLLFIILQRLMNTVSLVYQLDPLLAVLLPILLSAAIGLYLLRRAV